MEHPLTSSFGELLRQWRQRRHFSQLNLALDTEMSQRHLSFMESGRAKPSRDMVLRLAEQLELPPRERNIMLLAAGFAPVYPERRFDAPDFAMARETIELILDRHMPNPALAVDRRWNLLMANKAAQMVMAGCAEHLLTPPINVLRLSLSIEGIAGRILNFPEWRGHVLTRLSREAELSGDPALHALLAELEAMPHPPRPDAKRAARIEENDIAIPLQLESPAGPLSFISMTSVFGTATDVTLAEVTIETLLPADAETARIMAATTSLHGLEAA